MYNDTLVAILAYNEEKNISNVLSDVCKAFNNVLVVDNNSDDLTVDQVKAYPVFLIKHLLVMPTSGPEPVKTFKNAAFYQNTGACWSTGLLKVPTGRWYLIFMRLGAPPLRSPGPLRTLGALGGPLRSPRVPWGSPGTPGNEASTAKGAI